MAAMYLKTAGGNWSAAGTWSATGAGGVDSVGPPTAATDVILETLSGNLTIDSSTSSCRSISLTSGTGAYGGTITHNAACTLTIGDGTAGAGNVALDFGATFTYTLGSSTTSAISFISTSATVQTINFNNKNTGNVTFNATSNGSWQYTGAHQATASGIAVTVTLTKGTLDINGQTVIWRMFSSSNTNVRSLSLGAASVTINHIGTVWDFTDPTNLTFNAGTSTITFGNNGNTTTFAGGGQTYSTVIFGYDGTYSTTITGANSFTNLTRNGITTKTAQLILSNNQTVTGVLTLAGGSGINRLLVLSNTVGTARTITNTGATMTISNTDFQDITMSTTWDASARTDIGDCGGNTSITFPAAVQQTWSGTSGGNWSANAWTTRVPLPQDDVVISSAFSASQTITADMPRLGKSISWSGATGTPVFAMTSTANNFYGSMTFITGMTISGNQIARAMGRSSFTITSSGKSWGSGGFTVDCVGGTYTLNDAFTSGGALNHSSGTLVTNGFNVTTATYAGSGTTTRALTLGSTTWSITKADGTSTVWNLATTTNMTLSAASSTISFVTSTFLRNFSGGGLTYGTLTYTVAGSTGELDIIGSNTFTTINFSDASNARTLAFTAGTTTTILNSFNVRGSAAGNMTIGSITASGHTLSKATGVVNGSYLTISRSTAGGGAAWYAGATPPSVDNGNNSGWLFAQAPPSGGSGGSGSSGLASLASLQNIRCL